MAWTRFKQGTREVLGKSEKYTEIPKDIDDLHQTSEALIAIYQDLVGSNPLLVIKQTAQHATGSSISFATISSNWLKLCGLKQPDGTELDTSCTEFLRESADGKWYQKNLIKVVRFIEDIRLAFEAEVEDKYARTIKDVVKMCKDGENLYEKVKTRRLELDSKK